MENSLSGKADLHIHSEHSHDAFCSVEEILKKAKDSGMDIIAITDHNVISGSKRAEKIAENFGIKSIVGEEIDTKEGDLLGIFLKEFISPGKSALETIKEIHKQGGLAIIPHPLNWVVGGFKMKSLFNTFSEADGIETFNGSWLGGMGRKKIQKLNLTTFNLASIGSSDSHLARQVGRSYTVFRGKTPGDLFLAIKKKETRPAGASWTAMDKIEWIGRLPERIVKEIAYRVRHKNYNA